jgi:hypothetical protein
MEQKPGDQEPKVSIAVYLWPLAIAIGTAIGVGIGAAIGDIGAGLAIGVGVGVVAGFVLIRRFNSNSGDDQHPNREIHSTHR